MTEQTIPITFLEQQVKVEWQNGDSVTGKIGEYAIGEYIILLTKQGDHLIPWPAIKTVWYQTEEQKAKPPPSRKTREREVAESESKPEAVDVVNWDPTKLEWETCESKSGKGPYERHPFTDQKAESKPDYHNLRDAILAVQKTGKHTLSHKESGYYYWLSDDTNVIMRRKSSW